MVAQPALEPQFGTDFGAGLGSPFRSKSRMGGHAFLISYTSSVGKHVTEFDCTICMRFLTLSGFTAFFGFLVSRARDVAQYGPFVWHSIVKAVLVNSVYC